jgi:hypothetical protein
MTMSSTVSQSSPEQSLSPQALYGELCQSYRAIDDFRSKLLGFLPFVSGAGILALLGPLAESKPRLLLPVGLFGFFVTSGLLCFELYGIRKCHALINAGKRLESRQPGPEGVPDGQFCSRADQVVDEPFASGVVYSAVGATWLYIAFSAITPWAWISSIVAAVLGFAVVMWYAKCWIPKTESPSNYSKDQVPVPREPELMSPGPAARSCTR